MNSLTILETLLKGKDSCELGKTDSDGNNIFVTIKLRNSISNEDFTNPIIDSLPKQYIDLLLYSNGMELFNYNDIDGLELLSINEIEKYTRYAKKTFEEQWQDNIIIFAKIIGEDNYLGFRKTTEGYAIIDCYFEELPNEWRVIAESFDSFLEKYLLSYGDKYWI